MSFNPQPDLDPTHPAALFAAGHGRSWDRTAGPEELTAGEERRLARLARAGDRNARRVLIEAAVPLVTALVRNYRSPRVERDDLVQEGMIGLCEALDRFDPEKGFRFNTYAAFWVKKRVLRSLYQQSRVIQVPTGLHRDARKARSAADRLSAELGRSPSHEELAETCCVTVKRVQSALACPEDAVSLEGMARREEGESSLEIEDEGTPNPERRLMEAERATDLDRLLSTLSERDRTVLEGRFGLRGATVPVPELAARLNTSCDVIRQIQHRALNRLRRTGRAEMLLA